MSEVKKVKNESIKESSNGLRGTIAEELNDESLIASSAAISSELLKSL